MRSLNAILFIILLFSCPAMAQINYSPVAAMPSANAMNLGIYGQTPVSHHTGVPDISIPVYTISAGNITVPVSFNYHAGGVKVEVHPSWVGLGWSLNAGGQITRVQKGIRDDLNEPDQTSLAERGYYFTHARNNHNNWAHNDWLSNYPGFQASDFKSDSEPDEFSFSYPGNSGKFFLSEAGTWQVQSDRPCKVIFEPQDFDHPFAVNDGTYNFMWAFKKFTILDEFGNRFIFGNSPSSIEFSEVFGQNLNDLTATSWFLTKIVSADGSDVIEFNYDRGPLTAQLYVNLFRRSVTINGAALACGNTIISWPHGGILEAQRGNVVSPVYLRSIRYPRKNIKLEFFPSKSNELSHPDIIYDNLCKGLYKQGINMNTDPQVIAPAGLFLMSHLIYNTIPYWQTNPYPMGVNWPKLVWLKLDRIEIKDESTSTLLKSVTLHYNNASNERLRLWKVNFKNASDAQVSAYELAYNPQPLPPYLFGSMGDHWGYLNGSVSAVDVVGAGAWSTHYNLRQPNPAFAQAGILTEIIYPTGGKTKFEYELNAYSKYIHPLQRDNILSENGPAGGLRIKKVTNIDGTKEESTEYFYVTGYTAGANPGSLPSSGVLDTKPYYEQTNVILYQGSSASVTYNVFSTTPVIPLTPNSKGQHIGYTEVVERRSDGAYTIYTYTNHDNGYHDVNYINTYLGFFQFNIPPSSRDFERGRLLEKKTYNKNGTLLLKETNEYERIGNTTTQAIKSIKVGLENWCTIPPTQGFDLPDEFGYFYRTAYLQYYYPFVLKKNTAIAYDESNPGRNIQTVTNYTYLNKLPKTVSIASSAGFNLVTENFYPQSSAFTAPHGDMMAKNMLNYVVKTEQYNGGNLVKRITNDYKVWDNGEIYPERSQVQVANNTLQTITQVNNMDEQGNPLQLTHKNGLTESYEWGYSRAFPIAKVLNAQNTFTRKYTKAQRYENLDLAPSNPSVSFTTGYYGPVTIQLTGNAANTNTVFSCRGTVTGPESRTFELCRNNCAASGVPSSITFQDLPPGTYTINVTFRTLQTPPHCTSCSDPDMYIRYSFFEKQFQNTQGVKEFLFEDFEEAGGWDNGLLVENVRSRTGKSSGSIYKPSAGDLASTAVPWQPVSFTAPVKYRFSGWVYSAGPGAELVMLMKRAGETGDATYTDNITTAATNQWVFIEKEFTVPADVVQITMRAINKGGGYVWFDDIRMHPSNAEMITYSYDPAVGMTSQTDINNRTQFFEYDEFQRLKLIRDPEGTILKIIKYQYKQ